MAYPKKIIEKAINMYSETRDIELVIKEFGSIKRSTIEKWLNISVRMFEVVFKSLREATGKKQNTLFKDLFDCQMDDAIISKYIGAEGNCNPCNLYDEKLANHYYEKLKNTKSLQSASKKKIRELYNILEYNKPIFDEEFLNEIREYYSKPDTRYLLYYTALIYAMRNENPILKFPSDSDDNENSEMINNENSIINPITISKGNDSIEVFIANELTYTKLIEIIQESLGISKYDAVTLTIPDKQLQWEDAPNDHTVHFLNSYKEEIDASDNVLEILKTISKNCSDLDDYFKVDRLRKSVVQIYTYQYHLCFEKIFRKLFNNANDETIYKILHNFLFKICRKCDSYDNMKDKVNEVLNYLDNQQETSGYELLIEEMAICFYKLSSFVLLSERDTIKPNFSLTPLTINEYDEIERIVDEVTECTDKKEKIRKYSRLHKRLRNKTSEYINVVCNECYKDFFRLVNDVNIQDELILVEDPEQEESLKEEILALYYLIYSNVKYKLYRGYKRIESNAGIMRNSLFDRVIVMDYLKEGVDKEKAFRYLKTNNEHSDFILRLANENDITSIIKLNNPPKPYRRAIYVKSDDDEIRAAINEKSVWVIEEQNDNERNIACVAIIISSKMMGFNSTDLNKNYEIKYYGKENPDANYLDFDSVLVNDGRSGVNTRSYRGYGFQRLCLVLAEELAKERDCDYICATVSTFNGPSKRNFALNGYHVADNAVYPLKDGNSSFYDYITNPDTPEEEKIENEAKVEREIEKYGSILDGLKIDRDRYREDKDVPRDFVVLKLK